MRRSGMSCAAVTFSLVLIEAPDPIGEGHNHGLPSYTEARWAPPARPRAPRHGTRAPEQLERAAARRTDREPGRRRARSRDYARTGRCSRRPAP